MKDQADSGFNFLQEFYLESKARLADYSVYRLVNVFNRETVCKGWTGSRGAFLKALMETLSEKGVDISAVSTLIDGNRHTSFKYPVFLTKGKHGESLLKQIIVAAS